jgi:hypothetical protein
MLPVQFSTSTIIYETPVQTNLNTSLRWPYKKEAFFTLARCFQQLFYTFCDHVLEQDLRTEVPRNTGRLCKFPLLIAVTNCPGRSWPKA